MAFSRSGNDFLHTIPGSIVERREAAQRAEEERAALRRSELDAQVSPVNDPQERIRIWERLHALRLPLAPEHALVQVIAKQTRLTIGQVREEQQRRASLAAQSHAAAGP